MKKLLIIVLLGVVVLSSIGLYIMGGPPRVDLSPYMHLREPAISALPAQRVIQVTAKGAPSEVSGEAIGRLFRTYFSLDEATNPPPAPRARWPVSASTPQSQWVGRFAMPIPDSVSALPAGVDAAVELATWEYGEVAEILHIGAYDAEQPSVATLTAHVEQEGYVIAGEHEEEYLKGPGWLFAGNPDEYATIIRYPVRRKTR
jgi:effector-binding domain-containing protein